MKKILLPALIVLLIAIVAGLLIINKPHRDPSREEGLAVDAQSLLDAYLKDEAAANTTFLDKTLAVTGTVREVTTNQENQTVIILSTNDPVAGIVCAMDKKPKEPIKAGTNIKIKGICSGYTLDVILRNCTMIPE